MLRFLEAVNVDDGMRLVTEGPNIEDCRQGGCGQGCGR